MPHIINKADLNARWQRLLDTGKASWMGGMRVLWDDDEDRIEKVEDGVIWLCGTAHRGKGLRQPCAPDWEDPATLGCLTDMMRSAWSPNMRVWIQSVEDGYDYCIGWNRRAGEGEPPPDRIFLSEAEAIIAAIERSLDY